MHNIKKNSQSDGKKYSRIMIFGCPGGGKSTFSLILHHKTGLPLYHLDRYFFQDNWVERDYDEFLGIQQGLVNQDQWIIDGNMTKSLEMRYQRAHLCFYFHYPLWQCYYRVFKRRLFDKNPAIADRAEGCSEVIQWKFLTYIWGFEKRVTDSIKILRERYPSVRFIEIRRDEDLQKLDFSSLFDDN